MFLWFDPQGKYNGRHGYGVENVNQLKRAVDARLSLPHEFVVVTQPERFLGFDPDIRVVPIDESLIRDGKRWPKLMVFRPDAGELIGKRILMLDLDADVCGPLDALAGRPEDFVGWRNPNPAPRHTVLNSSIVLLTAGARPQVWRSFNIDEATAFAKADRRGGSDQAHVSRILGDGEAMWTEADGVYWARTRPAGSAARIVFHAGWDKPERFAAMLTVVCFLWRPESAGIPPRYSAAHVNALRDMLERHLSARHRLVCVTDAPQGLDRRIAIVRPDETLPKEARYRKLMFFRRDAAQLFSGNRLLLIDLDVTAVGELAPLVDRAEEFVIWRDPLAGQAAFALTHRYNSSIILMNAGCRPQVYEQFRGRDSIEATRASGLVGSDQAWIGLTLGGGEAVWTAGDGVLGWKHDLGGHASDPLSGRAWPGSARLIVSHGRPKPWDLAVDHPLRLAYEDQTAPRKAAA